MDFSSSHLLPSCEWSKVWLSCLSLHGNLVAKYNLEIKSHLLPSFYELPAGKIRGFSKLRREVPVCWNVLLFNINLSLWYHFPAYLEVLEDFEVIGGNCSRVDMEYFSLSAVYLWLPLAVKTPTASSSDSISSWSCKN